MQMRIRCRVGGKLRALRVAQQLFREGDKEQDGNFDYGTLNELSQECLILGSGPRDGYVYDCAPSATTPEFLWFAVANPTVPGSPSFCTNQAGVVYYATTSRILLNTTDCELPPGVLRLDGGDPIRWPW